MYANEKDLPCQFGALYRGAIPTYGSPAEAFRQKVAIPQDIQKIPDGYFEPSLQPGTIQELTYQTYESFSYRQKSRKLQKRAIVYLPYGYQKDQPYDVFYLMHGGGGDENATLGNPQRPSRFKNVIDHAMAAGDIRPLIIVCPTYNNTNENGRDSNSFSLAMQLTENFPNELLNDLIPAVEGKYRTFAATTRREDIVTSRDHRGFGGFSMGSVATWRTFQYALNEFRYFLPMSCGTTLNDEQILAAASGRRPQDYFVFAMTGTNDFAYTYDQSRTQRMRASRDFVDADRSANGNFAYRVKPGYSHGGTAAMEYTYNGMKAFWGGKDAGVRGEGALARPHRACRREREPTFPAPFDRVSDPQVLLTRPKKGPVHYSLVAHLNDDQLLLVADQQFAV